MEEKQAYNSSISISAHVDWTQRDLENRKTTREAQLAYIVCLYHRPGERLWLTRDVPLTWSVTYSPFAAVRKARSRRDKPLLTPIDKPDWHGCSLYRGSQARIRLVNWGSVLQHDRTYRLKHWNTCLFSEWSIAVLVYLEDPFCSKFMKALAARFSFWF